MAELLLYHNGVDIPTAPPMDVNGLDIGYGFDWTEYLQEGEFIIESGWTIDSHATINYTGIMPGNITAVGLNGLSTGTALVTNRVTTTLGTDERSFYVQVTEL